MEDIQISTWEHWSQYSLRYARPLAQICEWVVCNYDFVEAENKGLTAVHIEVSITQQS